MAGVVFSARRSLYGFGMIAAALIIGCGPALMALRVIYGDPLTSDQFQQQTKIDLTEGEHSVLLLCTVPYTVNSEVSDLRLELLDGLARRLKQKGVKMVSTSKVLTWLDDHGGVAEESEFPKLAREMDADVIILVKIEHFDTRVESSPDLLQGKALGKLRGWKVVYEKDARKKDKDQEKLTEEELIKLENKLPKIEAKFFSHFDVTYPPNNPEIARNVTQKTFLKNFTDRLITRVGMYFHSYRQSDVPF